MMCNEGCKGYVMRALNEMIKTKEIDYETAFKVLACVNDQFGELSED